MEICWGVGSNSEDPRCENAIDPMKDVAEERQGGQNEREDEQEQRDSYREGEEKIVEKAEQREFSKEEEKGGNG